MSKRRNLAMRMDMRHLIRLTNASPKNLENPAYAVALHFTHIGFVRIHGRLRTSQAMAAGVADRLWEIGDIVALAEATDEKPGPRGLYRSRLT